MGSGRVIAQTVGRWPQAVDIEVAAGEPVDFTVPVLDDEDAPVNASGWTAVAQARRYPGGPLLHVFALETSAAGVRVRATGADTSGWSSWPTRCAKWDLWVTEPDQDSRPLARGRVLVRSPISEVS